MKIDRKGMRPCNKCLKLRAGIIDKLGKVLPQFKPELLDLDVHSEEGGQALVRMRMDTGLVLHIEPDRPGMASFWRKMLRDRHVMFERDPLREQARLKDRVTHRYFPVTVMASKITDSATGETLSPTEE